MLGEDPPGIRLELVDGEIEMSPSPLPQHSRVILRLSQMLLNHLDAHDGGEVFSDVDLILGPHDVRRPDVFFYGPQHSPIRTDRPLDTAPDLAVEVISPSSGRIDREVKFDLYRKHGIAWYWLIDPTKRTFEAFELALAGEDPVLTGSDNEEPAPPPIEGFRLSLSRLWAGSTAKR